jgi:hypothetical protein
LLPTLTSCSSSPSPDDAYYHSAASAYPSVSIVDLMSDKRNSGLPAATPQAGSAETSPSSAQGLPESISPAAPSASTAPIAAAAVPAQPTAAVAAARAQSEDNYYHSAASVYPSVSLMDLFSGADASQRR